MLIEISTRFFCFCGGQESLRSLDRGKVGFFLDFERRWGFTPCPI